MVAAIRKTRRRSRCSLAPARRRLRSLRAWLKEGRRYLQEPADSDVGLREDLPSTTSGPRIEADLHAALADYVVEGDSVVAASSTWAITARTPRQGRLQLSGDPCRRHQRDHQLDRLLVSEPLVADEGSPGGERECVPDGGGNSCLRAAPLPPSPQQD